MTGPHSGFHGKANGAFFPLVHGMELRRVQQRFLASLLRQPALVPTVLTTGIVPEDFPEEWRRAFIMATKEPGRAKQIVPDPHGDPTIRNLYMQIVLLGHGQARQMKEQIVASIRRRNAARRRGDYRPSGANNLTDGDAEPVQQLSDLASNDEQAAYGDAEIRGDDDRQNEHVRSHCNQDSQETDDAPESASKGAKKSERQRNYEPVSLDEPVHPASYFEGQALPVHCTALDWLAAGCRGVVILDPERFVVRLSALPARPGGYALAAADLTHAKLLRASIGIVDCVRLLVPLEAAA